MSDYFPGAIASTLKSYLAANMDGIDAVVARPLNANDPNCSVGIVMSDWAPGATEIGKQEPTLASYTFTLQLLVKHANEEQGLILHSLLTKSLRTMLYRDQSLRLTLLSLSETSFGVTERLKKYVVQGQRFMNNKVGTSFMYLSLTDLRIEVEIA